MCREDNHSFGFDLLSDFLADFLEFGIGWMVVVFNDVRSAMREEVDWCARHCGRGIELRPWLCGGDGRSVVQW